MNKMCIDLNTLEDTNKFGIELGRIAIPGDVICLSGDLGAGKTTLTQKIAMGLQVPKEMYVTSPTFAVFHEYPGRLPLYHMDFYRLDSLEDVEDLGLVEYFYQSGLTVIEWPDKAKLLIPASRLYLTIKISGEEKRSIECDVGEGDWGMRLPVLLHGIKTKVDL